MSLPLFYMKDVTIAYDNRPLLRDITFQVCAGDKIALIGSNGSGKTSLMKAVTRELDINKGELYLPNSIKVGYLPQTVHFDPEISVHEFVLSNIVLEDGEMIEQKHYLADMILEKLHLCGTKIMKSLSGGKIRRAALAKALLEDPDILFLDEPTNHLDITAVEWLEDYLKKYRGGLILISHDREFLRNITNRMIWIDRGAIKYHTRGFKEFEEWSTKIMEEEIKTLSKLSKEVDKENLWLQQGVTARRKRNQQRLGNLYKLREKLKQDAGRLTTSSKNIAFFELSMEQRSKLILDINNISFQFTDVSPPKPIIKNLSLRVIKGERIGLMGSNGAGKTTLLKIITGQTKPDEGSITYGAKLKMSYFDQHRESLDEEKTLWETLCPDGGDTVFIGERSRHVVAYLKDFLFTPEQIKGRVSILSGGQKNRLLLARILLNPGNFLILDEPTNDLDVDTLDMLLEILDDYKGTILIVSHDRDFLNKLVTRSIILDGNGEHEEFFGGYDDHMKSKFQNEKLSTRVKKAEIKTTENTPGKKLSYKFQREWELLPAKIDALSLNIKEIEDILSDEDLYLNNSERFTSLSTELVVKKDELEKLEIRWLELDELHNRG